MADLQQDFNSLKKGIFAFVRKQFKQKKKIKVKKGHMTQYMGGYLKKEK